MRSLLRIVLTGQIALFALLTATTTQVFAAGTLDDYLACPMSDQIRNKEAAIGWWNRRSELEQRLILSVPCAERFAPIICVFLYNPDLQGCTAKSLAEYRANKSCQDKGHDLLSQEMADCKDEFKRNYRPATS